MAVSDYSTTAGDNTSISGITVTDSTLANQLDNIIRQMMADIKEADDANAKSADHPLVPVAHCHYNGATPTVWSSSGFSSVSKAGTGDYTFTFTTAFGDVSDYYPDIAVESSTASIVTLTNLTTSGFSVRVFNTSFAATDRNIRLKVWEKL